MSKITLTDTSMDVILKMSNGNPGAMDVIMKLLTLNDSMGGLGKILLLDTYEIYGTDIYILYNDICRRSLSKMVAVIRATQIGFFNNDILKKALQDSSGKHLIPVDELYRKVKEKKLFRLEIEKIELEEAQTEQENPKMCE